MKRRFVVSAVGTALAASLAGCLGSEPDDGGTGDEDADTTGTGTTDEDETGETVFGGQADDLAFGDSYVSPQQIATTVHGIDLTETLTYETIDGTDGTRDAGDGEQFALVEFEARNEAAAGSHLPFRATIDLAAGGDTYHAMNLETARGQYDAGSVDHDVSRRGWIAYAIPADLTVSELAVTYDLLGEDDWSATWRAE